ncbi:MAG TPA: GIY-YIG nuclease family protein [Gammaproteobacteria bacterium]|nr:GIY-YIG nuclease family protein [Gammaproteobacteria bacterium]
MEASGGTYVLILRASSRCRIAVGRRGWLAVEPGYYSYVGSAFGPGGLRARLGRHLRQDKALRWHIDWLRRVSSPVAVWYSTSPERLEHVWAAYFQGLRGQHPVAGFGCSDCRCLAHLFFGHRPPGIAGFRRHAGARVRCWYPPATAGSGSRPDTHGSIAAK